MKRKLQLRKETLRTLSAEHLQQVASGSGSYDGCDAPMFMGSAPLSRPMDVQPIATP